MKSTSLLLAATLAALTSCTQFPVVETIEGADVTEGDFPRLLPLDEVLDAPDPSVTPALEEEVVGRVDALRARASRLSRPVIDRPTRTRMERGVIIDPATR